MYPFKRKLLASTMAPLAFVAAAGMTVGAVSVVVAPKPALSACAPCNPCAAKNPCNPCAAANPCNPCGVKNPCNPCAAANPCNPCAAGTQLAVGIFDACEIPRLARAAYNPCNPCAAKNPCNPCAAANPCNPCAAANPCGANPCGPCGAGAALELTDAEAADAYDCMVGQMRAAYARSGNATAASYAGWRRYSRVAYQSSTHGGRYVQNYANATARAYGEFEKAGVMPIGSIIAKDSFGIDGEGHVSVGPLFTMEKMPAGFNPASGDWKYGMIMPNGSVFGETNGKNAGGMQFCAECHAGVGDTQDHMMLVPSEYRTR